MSKRLVLLLCIVMILGIIATPAAFAETIVTAVQSCRTDILQPDTNRHDSSKLSMRSDASAAKSWVKFDIRELDLCSIGAATLTVALHEGKSGARYFDVSYVNDNCRDNIDWDERSLTWNNAPGNKIDDLGGLDPDKTTLLTTVNFTDGVPGDSFTFDVLDAFKTDTDGIVQFVFHNSNGLLNLSTHDHAEEAWRPFLTLTEGSNPGDGAIDVPRDAVLSWLAGINAVTYDVYLGPDITDVNKATRDNPLDVLVSTGQEETTYDPLGLLDFGQTYYWRVDEVNDVNPDSPWKGELWSFTVTNFIVVEDFEDYNDYPPDEVWNTWIDGYGVATNGATSGYPDPDFLLDEHYMETFIVHSGRQSMPLFYNNTTGISEATKTLTGSLRDWTQESVVTLTIFYYGDAANAAEPMYVALNGNAVVTNEDVSAALVTDWTRWDIPLQEFTNQGVNLVSVNLLTLGFGNKANPTAGGEGHVFFDDIRLYR